MLQPKGLLARVGVADAPKVRSPGRQYPVRENRADQRPDILKLRTSPKTSLGQGEEKYLTGLETHSSRTGRFFIL